MSQTDNAPLGYLLHRIGATLRPQVAAALGPLDLSLAEFVCMRMLSLNPGMSSAELSRHGNVTPQAMNTVLRQLQERGAVARPATVASGRSLPATLTRDGLALLKRAETAVLAADGRLLARLSPAEQREFKRMLELLGTD